MTPCHVNSNNDVTMKSDKKTAAAISVKNPERILKKDDATRENSSRAYSCCQASEPSRYNILMRYEIDQSGKIEDTAKQSVLAFSNGDVGAVVLTAKDKRRLQERLRRLGAPKLFVDVVFSVLLASLTKPLQKKGAPRVLVDIEYPGHTDRIKRFTQQLTGVDIEWKLIGKQQSRAHDVAYNVYKRKLCIGRKLSFEDVWPSAKKIAGGYLNFGLSPKNRYSVPASKKSIAHRQRKSRRRGRRG